MWSILMIVLPVRTDLCGDPCAAAMEAVCGNIITQGPLSQRFASGIQWEQSHKTAHTEPRKQNESAFDIYKYI